MPGESERAWKDLQGRSCLITAASRTLGAVIARVLARAGAAVAVNYQRNAKAAEALCEELRGYGASCFSVQADVSNPVEVARMTETVWQRFNGPDLLVNCAGPYVDAPFLSLAVEDFDLILASNARSTFLVSAGFGRLMKKRGGGKIINISATSYLNRSHSVYGMAKACVVYLTEAMALELAPEVRVNAIAPDLLAENEEMDAEFARRAAAGTPLGRLVTRREVAEALVLLCTSPFDFCTGTTVVLDGGRSIPRLWMG